MREREGSYGRRDNDRDSGSGGGSGGGFWSPRGPPSTAPVNVGDELEVTIEAVGVKGDGIAKKDGFVLFVPNAKAGQKIKIRITKVLRKVGFAEIVGGSQPAASSEGGSSEETADAASPAEEPSAEDSEDFGEDK